MSGLNTVEFGYFRDGEPAPSDDGETNVETRRIGAVVQTAKGSALIFPDGTVEFEGKDRKIEIFDAQCQL